MLLKGSHTLESVLLKEVEKLPVHKREHERNFVQRKIKGPLSRLEV